MSEGATVSEPPTPSDPPELLVLPVLPAPRARGWRRVVTAFDRHAQVFGTALALFGIVLILCKTPSHKSHFVLPEGAVVPAAKDANAGPAEPAPPLKPEAAAPG